MLSRNLYRWLWEAVDVADRVESFSDTDSGTWVKILYCGIDRYSIARYIPIFYKLNLTFEKLNLTYFLLERRDRNSLRRTMLSLPTMGSRHVLFAYYLIPHRRCGTLWKKQVWNSLQKLVSKGEAGNKCVTSIDDKLFNCTITAFQITQSNFGFVKRRI